VKLSATTKTMPLLIFLATALTRAAEEYTGSTAQHSQSFDFLRYYFPTKKITKNQ